MTTLILLGQVSFSVVEYEFWTCGREEMQQSKDIQTPYFEKSLSTWEFIDINLKNSIPIS